MSIRLYELTGELRELQYLAQDGSVPNEELRARLDALPGLIEDKIVNIIKLYRELEIEADAFKAEKERIAEKEKATKAAAERLKSYALFHAQAACIQSIRRPEFTASLRVNPWSVAIEDESQIPARFFAAPPPKPSLALIKEALLVHQEAVAAYEASLALVTTEDGEIPPPPASPVPGAHIKRDISLQVR